MALDHFSEAKHEGCVVRAGAMHPNTKEIMSSDGSERWIRDVETKLQTGL